MGVRHRKYPENVEIGSSWGRRRSKRHAHPRRAVSPRHWRASTSNSENFWDTVEEIFWTILFIGPGVIMIISLLIALITGNLK